MPLRTLFKQLHRLDTAHCLHEITALRRRMDDVFLRRAPQRVIRHPADGGIHQQHHQHDRRQLRAVQQHQRQREHRHQAVQHQHKKRRSQRALNTVHLAETRHHIAQVPLDEIRRRQIQQMAEHIGLPLHIERRRQKHPRPRLQQRHQLLHQHQEAEAQRQREEQIAVGRDNRAVNHPLREKRASQRKHLQRCRQQQPQIGVKTVETEDGGKTSQAVFRRLGLQDNGQLAGKAERKRAR